MLQIVVPPVELWDEEHEIFLHTKEQTLRMEHSLVSIAKWESRWCKPFLGKAEKNVEEWLDYYRCMTITQNVDHNVYLCLTKENCETINNYINDKHSASSVRENRRGAPNREQITSELIYYWMITYGIPFECQTWHLNRLLMLIRICEAKNSKPKKRGLGEIARDYAAENAIRRKMWNTKG